MPQYFAKYLRHLGDALRPGPAAALAVLSTLGALAGTMSDPEVDQYNLRAGTQTFAPLYQFTGETKLVETAEAIRSMGSDVVKFYLGSGFSRQYDITLSSSITNLTALAKNEPSCRRVLDMPFRHYILWAYSFTAGGDTYWADGLSATERQREYNELYGFARHLLTNYNHSGKTFYLGHWEGDWYLLPGYVTTNNPSPTTIQGMRDWLNTRQQAVDDAKRDTAYTNVNVLVYAEANRVRDAMVNGTNSNQRLINQVVPWVTNLDCVSWSSYDGQNLSQAELFNTLNYMESMLPTNKAGALPGKRIFIGEYGWGGSYSSTDQEPRTRAYVQKLLQWGCPFILFWEMYNNEAGRSFWLVDNTGAKTPCYFLHQRYYNSARLLLAQFKQDNGRLPNDAEFAALTVPLLNQPLPAPVGLRLDQAPATAATNNATITGTLTQGIYGEDWAAVFLYWGASDGGTNRAAWEHVERFGNNARFGPSAFATNLNSLQPSQRYYYRFFATNASGEAWTPSSGTFLTGQAPPETLVPTGAVWRYFDQNFDPGANWREAGYNDSAWGTGAAQLGFGDGDETTPINSNRLRITTYFRRAFTVANASSFWGLNLRLLRDDGAVVYLNGAEVFRSNMPTGAITAATYASSTVTGGDESTNFYAAAVSTGHLRDGTNVLAVEVHQRDTNSSDLSFDLELGGIPPQLETLTERLIPPGSVWKFSDTGSTPGGNWTEADYGDQSWASGPARLGYGGDGERTTVSYGLSGTSKHITTYFRNAFEVADPLIYDRLTLRLARDDGAIVYLNGVEVLRSNLTNGPVSFSTTALAALSGADEFIFLQTNLPPSLLRAGQNVVAAEVHQSSGGSSDLGFELELGAEYTRLRPALPLGIAVANAQALVTWPRPATGFVLEKSGQVPSDSEWRSATNTPVALGPNNAVAATLSSSNEFFRLQFGAVDASTLTGKQLFGYQGWFACPLDTAPPNRWIHWFRSQTPVATNVTVDFWPDISELDPDELFATAMTLPGGQPARVYSPYRQKTVMRHFRWMHDHGVDGVFVQRFTSELGSRDLFEWRNQVALNVRAGAEAYGRVFAMMYDISGQNSNTLTATLQNDWNFLTQTLRLTQSARYLRHNGRPVVAVWGFGFTDRPGTAADAQQVIDFFHTNGCTVMGGVPTNWRTLDGDSRTDPAWATVYRAFDIISPWAVGRFSSDAGADTFKQNKIVPDLAAAQAAGRDYLPVVWPGFSWRNLNGGAMNQIPRNGGRFYWRQVYNAVSAGCRMLYGAMFDEMDEGTAMFKLAPTAAQLPAQGTFVPLNIDGYALPSDYYLRLAGEAGRMLRGETPLSAALPIVP